MMNLEVISTFRNDIGESATVRVLHMSPEQVVVSTEFFGAGIPSGCLRDHGPDDHRGVRPATVPASEMDAEVERQLDYARLWVFGLPDAPVTVQ